MAAIDDLNKAVADLGTVVTAVQGEVANLQAQVAAGPGANDPAISAAAATISGAVASLQALVPAPAAPAA